MPADLRLVPPAVATWLAAGIALGVGVAGAATVVGACSAGAVLLCGFGVRRERRRRGAGAVCAIAAATLLCACAGSAVAALGVEGTHRGPVPALAARYGSATVMPLCSSGCRAAMPAPRCRHRRARATAVPPSPLPGMGCCRGLKSSGLEPVLAVSPVSGGVAKTGMLRGTARSDLVDGGAGTGPSPARGGDPRMMPGSRVVLWHLDGPGWPMPAVGRLDVPGQMRVTAHHPRRATTEPPADAWHRPPGIAGRPPIDRPCPLTVAPPGGAACPWTPGPSPVRRCCRARAGRGGGC